MSNEVQTQAGSKSLLAQIKDEAAKSKRESVKAELKKLYGDWNKATEVVEGIEAKIIELLKSVGEDEKSIRSMLGD